MRGLLLCVLLCIGNSALSQCNYITDYYQDMYTACYLYIVEKNKVESYTILHNLNERCEMINSIGYDEMELYFKLCIHFEKYDEAYAIAFPLISKYGYKAGKVLEKLGGVMALDSVQLITLEKEYRETIDTSLVTQLRKIQTLDQKYRIFDRKNATKAEKDSLAILFHWADSVNQQQLMKIITTTGFPTIAQVGIENQELIISAAVFMHIKDTAAWTPILLKEIIAGRCPPSILGKMIDRRRIPGKGPRFLYGIYSNVKAEDIYEYENIDDRRKAIGMPPVAIEKAISSQRFRN